MPTFMGAKSLNLYVMMKIKIVAVGKVKEKYFLDGINEYLKRLTRFCDLKIVEIKEENFVQEPTESQKLEILKREGERILKELKGYVMVMAIEGQKVDSKKFSKIIKEVKDKDGEMTFVIGGSYGILEEIKEKANLKISFSDMTFPHTLFRLMLVEQIYRGFMIGENSKYHK